jgi:hypothetical protein
MERLDTSKAAAMERRQDNRINALLNAEEQVMIENGSQLAFGTLLNLGAGGALLELKDSSVQFPAGDTFHLLFDNGGELLELDATAIRTDGSKTAFRFPDLSGEQKMAIQTKMIRMAIISARIHDGDSDSENSQPGRPATWEGSSGTLVGEEL